jgi:hypothetical protein
MSLSSVTLPWYLCLADLAALPRDATEATMDNGMLTLLSSATEALLTTQDKFWLFAALTDRGFEEGQRNRNFGQSLRTFADVGVPDELLQALGKGINGMLADQVRRLDSACSVSTQPSGGRDLLIHHNNDGPGIHRRGIPRIFPAPQSVSRSAFIGRLPSSRGDAASSARVEARRPWQTSPRSARG